MMDPEKKKRLEAAYLEKQLQHQEKDEALEEELEARAAAIRENGKENNRISSYSKRFYTAIVIVFVVLIGLGIGAYHAIKMLGEPACRTHCCDGTCSPSTGSGTCSYHGGVCEKKAGKK